MEKLSVVIITKNEERNIQRCLESVKWADEIVVVDSGSEDRTIDICRSYHCKIYQTDWMGFGPTKKFAVDSASHDWIFSIDADEEVSPELKNRIQKILEDPGYMRAYRIKRNSFYLGKLIRHSGWSNDYTLRFFNRLEGNFNNNIVHESVQIPEPIGKLKQPLWHYPYPDVSTHIQKMERYSSLGAQTEKDNGKKCTLIGAVFRGKIKFIKMYFINGGFMDGSEGFILALNSAFGVYLKYLKLWKMNK